MKRILTLVLVLMLVMLAVVACTKPEEPHTHSATKTEQVNATCTAAGVKAYWYCSGCTTYFADEACANKIDSIDAWKAADGKIAALGHTTLVEKSAAVPETCTTAGKTAVMGCERCDYTEGGTEIAAKGHSATKTNQVDPTATTDGVKAYWTCSACSTNFSDEACTAKIENLDAWKTGDGKIPATGAPELPPVNEGTLKAGVYKATATSPMMPMPFNMVLTLKADNTFTLTDAAGADKGSGTWALTGDCYTLTFGAEKTTTFVVKADGSLLITSDLYYGGASLSLAMLSGDIVFAFDSEIPADPDQPGEGGGEDPDQPGEGGGEDPDQPGEGGGDDPEQPTDKDDIVEDDFVAPIV